MKSLLNVTRIKSTGKRIKRMSNPGKAEQSKKLNVCLFVFPKHKGIGLRLLATFKKPICQDKKIKVKVKTKTIES